VGAGRRLPPTNRPGSVPIEKPAAAPRTLPRALKALRTIYGKPSAPRRTDPFELILYENVAYLASDARRDEAFAALGQRVGLTPEEILAAPPAVLREIAARGILPAGTVEKLREIAAIAMEDFGGDLSPILRLPPKEATRALTKFPSIGEPGAEKILLFSGALPVLALDSNGLRVLLRLGFGKEEKSYAKSYRLAQEAAARALPRTRKALIEAHLLLRRHGQELCRRNHPLCEACPLRPGCRYYLSLSV
jgi:endonuclease III